MPYLSSATVRLYETIVRLAEKPKKFRLRRLGRLGRLGCEPKAHSPNFFFKRINPLTLPPPTVSHSSYLPQRERIAVPEAGTPEQIILMIDKFAF